MKGWFAHDYVLEQYPRQLCQFYERNLVIFSTKNMLYVTFTTLKRTAPVQNRGFFGLFEFSESFVKLGKFLTASSK